FIAKVENGERKLDVVEFALIARLLDVNTGPIMERIGRNARKLR
ncbi:XRE family transcriptional regulator, partial [Serratia marcescens]